MRPNEIALKTSERRLAPEFFRQSALLCRHIKDKRYNLIFRVLTANISL